MKKNIQKWPLYGRFILIEMEEEVTATAAARDAVFNVKWSNSIPIGSKCMFMNNTLRIYMAMCLRVRVHSNRHTYAHLNILYRQHFFALLFLLAFYLILFLFFFSLLFNIFILLSLSHAFSFINSLALEAHEYHTFLLSDKQNTELKRAFCMHDM